jgi:Fe-S-cluster-containing hydrogenase component 2
MKKNLQVTPSKCTGCRTCELACAFSHQADSRPTRTRINTYQAGIQVFIPVLCLQCEEAACVKVCPNESLTRNPDTGAIEVNERCIKCMACIAACPFGNISIDNVTNSVIKCDLCKGEPMCAAFCPSGALVFK